MSKSQDTLKDFAFLPDVVDFLPLTQLKCGLDAWSCEQNASPDIEFEISDAC